MRGLTVKGAAAAPEACRDMLRPVYIACPISAETLDLDAHQPPIQPHHPVLDHTLLDLAIMDAATLAKSMSTRTRSAAYAPQWSIAIRQEVPGESRPARVVANKSQLAVLHALYARTGENATKAEIDDVVRTTGL